MPSPVSPAGLEAADDERDQCVCGHWSRHHNVGKRGGCGHCGCAYFAPTDSGNAPAGLPGRTRLERAVLDSPWSQGVEAAIRQALDVLAPKHVTRDYRPEDAAADNIRSALDSLLAAVRSAEERGDVFQREVEEWIEAGNAAGEEIISLRTERDAERERADANGQAFDEAVAAQLDYATEAVRLREALEEIVEKRSWGMYYISEIARAALMPVAAPPEGAS